MGFDECKAQKGRIKAQKGRDEVKKRQGTSRERPKKEQTTTDTDKPKGRMKEAEG